MRTLFFLIFLMPIGCDENQPIAQNEPEVILRPNGDVNWYSGACVNFATLKATKVDYVMPNNEWIRFGFKNEGEFIGYIYIGPDAGTEREIEKKGEINGMKFDYYTDEKENHHYIFHTGFHRNTGAGEFFKLSIVKGYESEMSTILSSVKSGSPADFSLDYDSPGSIVAHPLSAETVFFVSKCNLRYDLGRMDRDGFDWTGFLRDRWYDLGGVWIPLEGEPDYPNIPDTLKNENDAKPIRVGKCVQC